MYIKAGDWVIHKHALQTGDAYLKQVSYVDANKAHYVKNSYDWADQLIVVDIREVIPPVDSDTDSDTKWRDLDVEYVAVISSKPNPDVIGNDRSVTYRLSDFEDLGLDVRVQVREKP